MRYVEGDHSGRHVLHCFVAVSWRNVEAWMSCCRPSPFTILIMHDIGSECYDTRIRLSTCHVSPNPSLRWSGCLLKGPLKKAIHLDGVVCTKGLEGFSRVCVERVPRSRSNLRMCIDVGEAVPDNVACPLRPWAELLWGEFLGEVAHRTHSNFSKVRGTKNGAHGGLRTGVRSYISQRCQMDLDCRRPRRDSVDACSDVGVKGCGLLHAVAAGY